MLPGINFYYWLPEEPCPISFEINRAMTPPPPAVPRRPSQNPSPQIKSDSFPLLCSNASTFGLYSWRRGQRRWVSAPLLLLHKNGESETASEHDPLSVSHPPKTRTFASSAPSSFGSSVKLKWARSLSGEHRCCVCSLDGPRCTYDAIWQLRNALYNELF